MKTIQSNMNSLWWCLQFYTLGLWWCHNVHEHHARAQLSDDAGDTRLCFWLHILIFNYSNPQLIQPTPAAPTCVNTRLPDLQHGPVHTALCSACRIYSRIWLHGSFIPAVVEQCSFNHIILPHCSNFLVNEADLMMKLNQSSISWGRLKTSSEFPEEPQFGSRGLRQSIINSTVQALFQVLCLLFIVGKLKTAS